LYEARQTLQPLWVIFLAQLNLVAAAGLFVNLRVSIYFLRRLLNLWAARE